VNRLTEWMQLPALQPMQDYALYPVYRARIRDAIQQCRAQKDALALAGETLIDTQSALLDAIQAQAGRKSEADTAAEKALNVCML